MQQPARVTRILHHLLKGGYGVSVDDARAAFVLLVRDSAPCRLALWPIRRWCAYNLLARVSTKSTRWELDRFIHESIKEFSLECRASGADYWRLLYFDFPYEMDAEETVGKGDFTYEPGCRILSLTVLYTSPEIRVKPRIEPDQREQPPRSLQSVASV
jgi:hypothetical protein